MENTAIMNNKNKKKNKNQLKFHRVKAKTEIK